MSLRHASLSKDEAFQVTGSGTLSRVGGSRLRVRAFMSMNASGASAAAAFTISRNRVSSTWDEQPYGIRCPPASNRIGNLEFAQLGEDIALADATWATPLTKL
jgi:hypothetical protein